MTITDIAREIAEWQAYAARFVASNPDLSVEDIEQCLIDFFSKALRRGRLSQEAYDSLTQDLVGR